MKGLIIMCMQYGESLVVHSLLFCRNAIFPLDERKTSRISFSKMRKDSVEAICAELVRTNLNVMSILWPRQCVNASPTGGSADWKGRVFFALCGGFCKPRPRILAQNPRLQVGIHQRKPSLRRRRRQNFSPVSGTGYQSDKIEKLYII